MDKEEEEGEGEGTVGGEDEEEVLVPPSSDCFIEHTAPPPPPLKKNHGVDQAPCLVQNYKVIIFLTRAVEPGHLTFPLLSFLPLFITRVSNLFNLMYPLKSFSISHIPLAHNATPEMIKDA